MFGPTETTTGGNALKFYASVRIDIRSRNPIKDGDDVLGKRAFIKVVKNKVAPPFRRAEFDIMFGEGISKSGEILDLGEEYGIINKSGSWFSYNGTKLAQGREQAKRVIQDNPELAEELEKAITEAINANDKRRRPAKAEAADAKAAEAEEKPATLADYEEEEYPDDFSIEEDI